MRRLIITADDFGRSSITNHAIIHAHLNGVLTCASIMINEPAVDEAVELAQKHPTLGVGLHLVLCDGTSALKPTDAPELIDSNYRFPASPIRAGFKYYFNSRLKTAIKHEIETQIRKFRGTGLKMDHINAHHNMHMHPLIMDILLELHEKYTLPAIRLTYDPPTTSLRVDPSRPFLKLVLGMVFLLLAHRNRPKLRAKGIPHTDRVFGLLQTNYVDERYLLRLIKFLPPGTSELYLHPGSKAPDHETQALTSPAVKNAILSRGIKLARYQDL